MLPTAPVISVCVSLARQMVCRSDAPTSGAASDSNDPTANWANPLITGGYVFNASALRNRVFVLCMQADRSNHSQKELAGACPSFQLVEMPANGSIPIGRENLDENLATRRVRRPSTRGQARLRQGPHRRWGARYRQFRARWGIGGSKPADAGRIIRLSGARYLRSGFRCRLSDDEQRRGPADRSYPRQLQELDSCWNRSSVCVDVGARW